MTDDATAAGVIELRSESAARQHLTGPLVGPAAADALTMLTEIVGAYAGAPTFTLSMAARCSTPARDLAALSADRKIVRLRCMRGSVYAVPAASFPVLFAATKEQVAKGRERGLKWAGVEAPELERLTAKLREVRAGQPPATVAELRGTLGELSAEAEKNFSIVASWWAAQGILVRAGVPGRHWRDDTVTYALTSDWLPGADLDAIDVTVARAELAGAYLRAFGPATTVDFHWWSGLGKREARAAIATAVGGAPADTELLRVDDAPAVASAPARAVRLLPAWDTYLVGYKDRVRQAAPEHLPWLYDKVGNATSPVVVDGLVVGVWQLHATDPVVVHVAWLPGMAVPDLDAVGAEAARVAALLELAAPPSAIEVVDLPPPLADRPRNAHLTPLPRPR